MAVLEDLIRAIELWLRIAKEQVPLVDPNLDPVLLVPGIGGSILEAVDEAGNKERVWVRILAADHECREKLWAKFDAATGKTVSVDEKISIAVPEDRYGLYAIDTLDPDMIIGDDSVYYYHDMIVQMIKWGYQEGKTLFGFGYDFRQSNRLSETLDQFSRKLESVYTASGGKKINLITHSMGGLLVKCFMSLHGDVFEKYVKSWIAIAAPFQGAPGYINSGLLNGMSFVEGWQSNFFISKWTMQQLLIECPSIYELLASSTYQWEETPLLQIWRERLDDNGKKSALLESYEPAESIKMIAKALSEHEIISDGNHIPLPLNEDILRWAKETQDILCQAKLPKSVKFYNIYGIDYDTAHTVCYGSKTILFQSLVNSYILRVNSSMLMVMDQSLQNQQRRMALLRWQELGSQLTTEESCATTTCSGWSSTGCTPVNLTRSMTPSTTTSSSPPSSRSRSTTRNAGTSLRSGRTGRSSPTPTTAMRPRDQPSSLRWSARYPRLVRVKRARWTRRRPRWSSTRRAEGDSMWKSGPLGSAMVDLPCS
ncbi:hypothetical protein ACQ4PT_005934 [Festuca glaucescens]